MSSYTHCNIFGYCKQGRHGFVPASTIFNEPSATISMGMTVISCHNSFSLHFKILIFFNFVTSFYRYISKYKFKLKKKKIQLTRFSISLKQMLNVWEHYRYYFVPFFSFFLFSFSLPNWIAPLRLSKSLSFFFRLQSSSKRKNLLIILSLDLQLSNHVFRWQCRKSSILLKSPTLNLHRLRKNYLARAFQATGGAAADL